jgi:16S rRNA (cytidine1402-2'-O)-methyltransferase
MLYIVSTPIGNLKDITYRAVEVLKTVDLIAAEDTRHSKILCNHYNITTTLTSFFQHNELRKGEALIAQLKAGKNVALVTDAGTPGISDPGYSLIHLAKMNKIPIEVIPGPTALIAALIKSALPMESFVFEGFPPVKSGARRKFFEKFTDEKRTVIFYESPHRILKTLEDIQAVLHDPTIVCARELTKKFEEVKEGKASELIQYFSKGKAKGEFVVLFNLRS